MRGTRARVVNSANGGTPGGMMRSNTACNSRGKGAETGSTRGGGIRSSVELWESTSGSPPNDEAHLPGGRGELPTLVGLYARRVRCSAWSGSLAQRIAGGAHFARFFNRQSVTNTRSLDLLSHKPRIVTMAPSLMFLDCSCVSGRNPHSTISPGFVPPSRCRNHVVK